MKLYVLGIIWCLGFATIFSQLTKDHIYFHKKFLKWEQKNITLSVHKKFMKDLVSEYEKQYELVKTNDEKLQTDILNTFQDALTSLMNNWNFHYFHIPIKSFYDSVKDVHKDSKLFQPYFKAYEKYDKNPADPNLKIKVQQEQKKVESLL